MDRIINWDLLRNPYNWIVVALMLAIGAYALSVVLPHMAGPMADADS